MRYLAVFILFVQAGCFATVPHTPTGNQNVPAERQPLRKSAVVLKSPEEHETYEEDGRFYDPKPRIVEIDKKAGKYELQWIGTDGQKKIIAYQRADAIDAVVEARVENTFDGRFLYKYVIKNLPSSPTYFKSFIVQSFAGDVAPIKLHDIHNGTVTGGLRYFREGIWRSFAIVGENTLDPGESIEFSLTSSGRPGIVECRGIAGDTTLKGVGEGLPAALERAIPGSDEWASGHTIGPDERLAVMNEPEKLKYLSDNMAKFAEAGWIAPETLAKYEAILKNQNLKYVFNEAKNDFKMGFITSEVFHIIEGLNR